MDPVLANRLEEDHDFRDKIKSLAQSYVDVGSSALYAHLAEFDVAYDMFYCYSPLSRTDLEMLDRGHPKRFVLPVAATEITTMSTYIAQMLFGTSNPHKVEARKPDDEKKADVMNVLLRWNSEQQPTYFQGLQWVQDALLCNRGVFYDHWQPLYECEMQEVQMEHPTEFEESTAIGDNGEAQIERKPKTYPRFKKVKKKVGGYTKMLNVSPYEFVCDPLMPLYRMQEGRFAGHKMLIPWLELERRSKLAVEDPDYVSPEAVERIKKKAKSRTGLMPIDGLGGTTAQSSPSGPMSRMRWDRDNVQQTWNQGKADKEDGGIIECWVMRIKLRPGDYDIYEDDEETNIWEILVGGDEVLSLNEDVYLHDSFPYSVGEGRGSIHSQFAPSWAMIIKPMQDHIDYLKDKHQEALARTVGNVFIGDPTMFDFEEFCDPNKIGLVIPTKPEASGLPIKDYIQQVEVKDMTAHFYEEMQQFINFSETATAANSQMQGDADEGGTATQSINAQQMAAGRLTGIARILSTTGLMPQTKRFVTNFQQFLNQSMVIRLTSDDKEFRPQFQNQRYIEVSRDTIQGSFDIVPVDMSMPGTDTKAVAAATRLLEVANGFPQLFVNTTPGNIDLRSLLLWTAKKSGMPIDNFVVDEQQANENKIKQMQAGAPPTPPQGQPNGQGLLGASGNQGGGGGDTGISQASGPDAINQPMNTLNAPSPSPAQAMGLPNLTAGQ